MKLFYFPNEYGYYWNIGERWSQWFKHRWQAYEAKRNNKIDWGWLGKPYV